MNYESLVWVMSVEDIDECLILYGFAAQTEKAISDWKKSDVKFKETQPLGQKKARIYKLRSVLPEQQLKSFFLSLESGNAEILSNSSDLFKIWGNFRVRDFAEVPIKATNHLAIKVTNPVESGALKRKTAWSVFTDPLGFFLQDSTGEESLGAIRYSRTYVELIDLMSNETGFQFRSDDFAYFGCFDQFANPLAKRLESSGFEVSVLKTNDQKAISLEGVEIAIGSALQIYTNLLVKVDLYSGIDRVHSSVHFCDSTKQNKVPINVGRQCFFSSYMVEIFDVDSGKFLTMDGGHLMTNVEIGLNLVGQTRNIRSNWTRSQVKRANSSESKTLENTTLITEHPGIKVGAKEQTLEPWRGVIERVSSARALFRNSEYDEYLPTLKNVSDETRTAPLLKLLKKRRYSKVKIFDPYFDLYSIEKLLIRLEIQNRDVEIFSRNQNHRTLKSVADRLEEIGHLLPCPVTLFEAPKDFHDRFVFLYSEDCFEAFSITNSLDGYSKTYPMWIVPMLGQLGFEVRKYVEREVLDGEKSLTPLWSSTESRERDRQDFSEKLKKKQSTSFLRQLSEFSVLESSGLLKNDGKVNVNESHRALDILFSTGCPNFSNLAELAYSGVIDENSIREYLKLTRESAEQVVECLATAISELQPASSSQQKNLLLLSMQRFFGEVVESSKKKSLDFSKCYFDLKSFIDWPERFYKTENRHRILLWQWLGELAPKTSFLLAVETKDIFWLECLVCDLLYKEVFLYDILKFSNSDEKDDFLFCIALLIVTSVTPDGRPNFRDSPIATFDAWKEKYPKLISKKLTTFAYIVCYGFRDNTDLELEQLAEKIVVSWGDRAPEKKNREGVNLLLRGGLLTINDHRVHLFCKRLEGFDKEWSESLYSKILMRLEGMLSASSGNFHFFHKEDNPMLEAASEILESWGEKKREEWFESALPKKIQFAPNQPFIKIRNHQLFNESVNQLGLWLNMKLVFVTNMEELQTVLDSIEEKLLPGAFDHNDFFGILRMLFSNLSLMSGEAKDHVDSYIKKWSEIAIESQCAWWSYKNNN